MLIDLTRPYPPVSDVRIECPACEQRMTLDDVEFGETWSEEFACDNCDAQITAKVTLAAKFEASARLSTTGGEA